MSKELGGGVSQALSLSDAVSEALESGQPVVALESTIISHGMPYPKNIETALRVEAIVRQQGAVPATIAVLAGKIRIGLTEAEIEFLGGGDAQILKLSRRDLGYALAMQRSGATTVAGTLFCAKMAGIRVFATGGVGGVHRGGEVSLDVSADLYELARTDGVVVCAGVKSILDIGRTLEVLETLGVPVVGYQTDFFPSFYSRESVYKVEYRMDDVREIAQMIRHHSGSGGVLVANPIPQSSEIPAAQMDALILSALKEAEVFKIRGKQITPFLLDVLNKKTKGQSLRANMALIENNAALAAQLARVLR